MTDEETSISYETEPVSVPESWIIMPSTIPYEPEAEEYLPLEALDPSQLVYVPLQPIRPPLVKELLVNLETTDVLPFQGNIYSIAYIDLSAPKPEAVVLADTDEEALITEFLNWFDTQNFTRIVGFNVSFDHRFIFAKACRYRKVANKWANVQMRDIMQILKQVQEQFVFTQNKPGTLDEWGNELLGYGKLAPQEDCLKAFLAQDWDFVIAYNTRQVQVCYDLYALLRYCSGESGLVYIPQPQYSYTPEQLQAQPEYSFAQQKKKCPNCLQENPLGTKNCIVCGYQL